MLRDKELEGKKIQEATVSPPSASSSPAHEFSFTISLHPPPPTIGTKTPDKNTKSTPSFAIDLSPADEIFFHGHLLPLHLLSHLPVSPRSSTNSLDSFTLPIFQDTDCSNNNNNNNTSGNSHHVLEAAKTSGNSKSISKPKPKSKSFSLFGISKWRREKEYGIEDDDSQKQKKRRLKFDVSRVVKRYMRLVKPFLSLRRTSRNNHHQQLNSFSGNLRVKSKKELWKWRRGEFSSAPASMITSPTNSGLLVASGTATPNSYTSESTMEELQAAIQAAIAHCKNSINNSAEDRKIKNISHS